MSNNEKPEKNIGCIILFVIAAIGMIIYDIEKTKRFWRKETLGLTDFDIKCINDEYVRRRGK